MISSKHNLSPTGLCKVCGNERCVACRQIQHTHNFKSNTTGKLQCQLQTCQHYSNVYHLQSNHCSTLASQSNRSTNMNRSDYDLPLNRQQITIIDQCAHQALRVIGCVVKCFGWERWHENCFSIGNKWEKKQFFYGETLIRLHTEIWVLFVYLSCSSSLH